MVLFVLDCVKSIFCMLASGQCSKGSPTFLLVAAVEICMDFLGASNVDDVLQILFPFRVLWYMLKNMTVPSQSLRWWKLRRDCLLGIDVFDTCQSRSSWKPLICACHTQNVIVILLWQSADIFTFANGCQWLISGWGWWFVVVGGVSSLANLVHREVSGIVKHQPGPNYITSRELTYPIPWHFWRWFPFLSWQRLVPWSSAIRWGTNVVSEPRVGNAWIEDGRFSMATCCWSSLFLCLFSEHCQPICLWTEKIPKNGMGDRTSFFDQAA